MGPVTGPYDQRPREESLYSVQRVQRGVHDTSVPGWPVLQPAVQLSLSQLGPVSAALSRHCGVTLHGFPGGTEDVQPQLGSQ